MLPRLRAFLFQIVLCLFVILVVSYPCFEDKTLVLIVQAPDHCFTFTFDCLVFHQANLQQYGIQNRFE